MGGDLADYVPRVVSEVTPEWLSAVMFKSLGGKKKCDKVEVVKIEGEKVQNGLLSSAFR